MPGRRTPRGAGNALKSPLEGSGAPGEAGALSPDLNTDSGPRTARVWRIFLPGRVGPWRKRTKTIAGQKISDRYKTVELPPSPNDRMHFQAKAALVKAWREDAKQAARAHQIPACERIRISAVLYRRALGAADEDNDRARLKPILDGLRDAGVIANDTRGYVEHGTVTEERGFPGVLLIVEEV